MCFFFFPLSTTGQARCREHDTELDERPPRQEAATGGSANAGRLPCQNRVPTDANHEGAPGATAAARAGRRAAAERRGD